ncbi:MAG: RDD family protein [Syntrophotaleaceae bacterium]
MKCPKCGYQSFNTLTNCKKCGRDLSEIQAKLNFGPPAVVTSPPLPHATGLPAETTEPTGLPKTAVQAGEIEQQHPAEEDGEHILEDFFQSIDTPQDLDLIPSSAPMTEKMSTSAAPKAPARKIAADFPQWQQEAPQGDFPFDELDADLDALRLSATAALVRDAATPFDDVDSFELNWQLPIEEDATGATESSASDVTMDRPPSATGPRPERKDPAAPQPAAEPLRAEPHVTEDEAQTPPEQNLAAVAEPETTAEEWLLPAAATGPPPGEEEFTLTGSDAGAEPTVEPALDRATALGNAQEELPLAFGATAPPQPADIAAIFLPDTELDSATSAARMLVQRAKAYLADLGLLTTIFALFVCAGEIARLPSSGERFRFTSDVLLDLAAPYFLVFFALCFGYFTLFHYLSGQTPGKMLFNLRVEGDNHADITLAQAFLRCVGGLVALLPAGLGYLSIVLDGEQKGWNDRLAGSRVVMVEEPKRV